MKTILEKPDINRDLFWDTDFNTIDFEKNARFVIQRVLERGNISDFRELVSFYGMERIKYEVTQIRYLDKKTLNFCSVIFGIDKKQFRCYNTEQSIRRLWNY